MRVHFFLRYSTRFGQNLFLKSEHPGLERGLIPMTYVNDQYWKYVAEVNFPKGQKTPGTIAYDYVLREADNSEVISFGTQEIQIPAKGVEDLYLVDQWNSPSAIEHTFFTQAFRKLLGHGAKPPKTESLASPSHVFQIKVPFLAPNQVPVLLGEGNAMHDWSAHEPVFMHLNGEKWEAKVDLSQEEFPISYKYALYNIESKQVERYEDGPNRTLYIASRPNELHILHDGFIKMPLAHWRGSGVAIPVFSLRTENSFGCGSFTDMAVLADWAAQVGMRVIQLLPINDTSATTTWTDSYPYASISAFALHPIYIDCNAIAGKKHAALVKPAYLKYQKSLADLDVVDYEITLREKWSMLNSLYEALGESTLSSADFKAYFQEQKHWLLPYAAFCVLKEQYKTADFNQWPKHSTFQLAEIEKFASPSGPNAKLIGLHYFVQYHLHVQLKQATEYANSKGLIVKGDIPIGIYRYSCDAWVAPELYNMDTQAGAPPDDFSKTGQNWGFPTYRWARMKEDGFAWWRSRFQQMSLYFDAFRIDHILGFFRIWSIPLDAVQGILGRFEPALPVHIAEFYEKGIGFDRTRLCEPFITTQVIKELFREYAGEVSTTFLEEENGTWKIKPSYNTQRKVEAWFETSAKDPQATAIRDGLYDLIANVILFETIDAGGPAYHFRYGIEETSSFRALDPNVRMRLKALYLDYFYSRQDDFWQHEAMEKLPELKRSTNMLICGEDLGMVPHCVPDVMRDLAMLSLEIQRMPKQTGIAFFNPKDAPYLSVVTPSTHDMSTIRGWWEEDRELTQRFYQTMFSTKEPAPFFCEPWINRAIVEQHLASPAMWSIFQLQDLLGIDGAIRRENPDDERINVPANPKHYWRYRMQMNLEDLMKQDSFNQVVKTLIRAYGRS